MGLGPHLYLFDLRGNLPVDPEHAHQDMTNAAFLNYLYEHSSWITQLFTYELPLNGPSLDEGHSWGEGQDESFSKDDLQQFLAELRKVPRPQDDDVFLAWNYDQLMRLVTLAMSNPHLTLTCAVL